MIKLLKILGLTSIGLVMPTWGWVIMNLEIPKYTAIWVFLWMISCHLVLQGSIIVVSKQREMEENA